MYNKYKNGIIEVIDNLEHNVPPIGYVPDRLYHGDKGYLNLKKGIKINTNVDFWIRPTFSQELIDSIKKGEWTDDPTINKEIEIEWERRLNGVWFKNNGKQTYITGLHYFYLTWWPSDTPTGYPDFRDPDRKTFYFWQYCCEDPKSIGMNIVSMRGGGKTAQMTCACYEMLSRTKNAHGGFTSKNDNEAKEFVYKKHLLMPFSDKMPYFFRPNYNELGGDKNLKGLFFEKSSDRKMVKTVSDRMFLNSKIDYANAGETGYDGPKLIFLGNDEIGKNQECDVNKRHNIQSRCVMWDTVRKRGNMWNTTTVQSMELGGANFVKLLEGSNQDKRVNGYTKTKLYRRLIPADEAQNFDKYGFPDKKENRKNILEGIERYSDDPYNASLERRISPLSWSDIINSVSGASPFDLTQLRNVERRLAESPKPLWVFGNLEWKEKDVEVVFMPSPTGKWCWSKVGELRPFLNKEGMSWGIKLPETASLSNCIRFPANNDFFGLGVDPIRTGAEARTARSGFGMALYMNEHPMYEFSNNFLMDYLHDPMNPAECYEDVIKTCFFLGTEVHVEKDHSSDLFNYMINRGYAAFIMNRPTQMIDQKEDKIPTPGTPARTKFIQFYISRLKEWSATTSVFCNLPRLIQQCIGFTFDERTKFDVTVAAGYAKVAAEAHYVGRVGEKIIESSALNMLIGNIDIDNSPIFGI